mgnify:CR=1 FL=1
MSRRADAVSGPPPSRGNNPNVRGPRVYLRQLSASYSTLWAQGSSMRGVELRSGADVPNTRKSPRGLATPPEH